MSFISRLWNTIRNPVRYVGRDLEGNKFFETRSLNDPSRMKRTVQYYDPENMWRYIGGGKQLPIQWSAWLTHTRRQAPTIEELEADEARRRRVTVNVAMIDARDKAEAAEMLRIRQQDAQQALGQAAARSEGYSSPKNVTQTSTSPQANGESSLRAELRAAESKSEAPIESTAGVRPPTFLTPAAPRKSKLSKPFSLPTLDAQGSVSNAEQQPLLTQAKADSQNISSQTVLTPNLKDPFPWKKTSETESWMPKARSRG